MGTNYYLETNICQCCKRSDVIHIGKNSFGWPFHWHVYSEDEGMQSAAGMLAMMIKAVRDQNAKIIDEYQREITLEQFIEMIEAKRKPGQNVLDDNVSDREFC